MNLFRRKTPEEKAAEERERGLEYQAEWIRAHTEEERNLLVEQKVT